MGCTVKRYMVFNMADVVCEGDDRGKIIEYTLKHVVDKARGHSVIANERLRYAVVEVFLITKNPVVTVKVDVEEYAK